MARELGLTRERVRQIESEALFRLCVRLRRANPKTIMARRRRARRLLEILAAQA